MTPTVVLRRVCDALNLTDAAAQALIAGVRADAPPPEQLQRWRSGDEECPEDTVVALLDGLILERRGPPPADRAPPPAEGLTNNLVLKKLRIALSLHEPDVLRLLDAGGHPLSARGLTPLFRKPGTKHYRVCDDAVLDAFLSGLEADPA